MSALPSFVGTLGIAIVEPTGSPDFLVFLRVEPERSTWTATTLQGELPLGGKSLQIGEMLKEVGIELLLGQAIFGSHSR
jgi:hypothetical protein